MHPFDTPTVEGEYRIMPSDIGTTRQYLSAFGQSETEYVALGVVLYCQHKGSWASFTEQEITDHFLAAHRAGTKYRFFVPDLRGGEREIDAYELFMRDSLSKEERFSVLWLNPVFGRLVRKGDDGRYRVTELFIDSCYKTLPASR